MNGRLLAGLAGLLAIGAALAWVKWSARPPGASEESPRPAEPARPEGDRARAAPSGLESPAEKAAVRRPLTRDAPVDEASAERIRQLEAEVADLRAELEARDPLPRSAEGILEALALLDPNDPAIFRANQQRRIALIERLLEVDPGHPRAAELLGDLSGEYLTVDPAQSLRVLELHAERTGIPAWRLGELTANALYFNDRVEEADRAYQGVILDQETPEYRRWNARFFAAYLYMKTGDYAEARRRFEALIALAGPDPDPAFQDTLDGARHQLELIEQYTREESER